MAELTFGGMTWPILRERYRIRAVRTPSLLVYGCVTTGTEWKFLCLDGVTREVRVDDEIYLVNETARLLGVFCSIVDESLAALDRTLPEGCEGGAA